MPCKRFALALLTTLLSSATLAKESSGLKDFFSNPGPKAERNYLSLGLSLNEFNKMSLKFVLSDSINEEQRFEGSPVEIIRGLTAQTYGLSLIYGSYLDDTFKTEFRYGKGIRDDTLEYAKDVNLNYWMGFYLGADQDITDYMKAYGLVGISHYRADVTRREVLREIPTDTGSGIITDDLAVQPSVFEAEPNLFKTNFSLSWILGLDYKLSDQWYLSFEYGRLLKDTDTSIEIDQYSTYLKFEF